MWTPRRTPADVTWSRRVAKRELLAWENEDLKASLFRGLADAVEGRVKRLGRLTENEDDEDE